MEEFDYKLMKAINSIYNRYATLEEVHLSYCKDYNEYEFIKAKEKLLSCQFNFVC